MSNYFKAPIVRVSIVLAALGFVATSVVAEPFAPRPVQSVQGISDNIVLVKHKKGHYKDGKRWHYNKRDGKRYRYRREGVRYYRDDYWYPRQREQPGIYIRLGT